MLYVPFATTISSIELSANAERSAAIEYTNTVLELGIVVGAVVGVGVAVGAGVDLKSPAGAYRYETPYRDLTVCPFILLIRNQVLPATVWPPHVLAHAVPVTLPTTSTRVFAARLVLVAESVDGLYRSLVALQAAYRVTEPMTALNRLDFAYR